MRSLYKKYKIKLNNTIVTSWGLLFVKNQIICWWPREVSVWRPHEVSVKKLPAFYWPSVEVSFSVSFFWKEISWGLFSRSLFGLFLVVTPSKLEIKVDTCMQSYCSWIIFLFILILFDLSNWKTSNVLTLD